MNVLRSLEIAQSHCLNTYNLSPRPSNIANYPCHLIQSQIEVESANVTALPEHRVERQARHSLVNRSR